jgi:FKBP-type peptidyl-prolyl cis-trans isomerase (trigger factor)
VAELVDALDLGSSSRKGVGVRFPPLVPNWGAPIMMRQKEGESSSRQIHPQSQTLLFSVTIKHKTVQSLYKHTLELYSKGLSGHRKEQGAISITYAELTAKNAIMEHVRKFLIHHIALDKLYKALCKNSTLPVGTPQLLETVDQKNGSIIFTFCCSSANAIQIDAWNKLPFRAPRRKQYKDIDRQVDNCIQEEVENTQKYKCEPAAKGDWVRFTLTLANEKGKAVLTNKKADLWIKIGYEEADLATRELFIGKKVGETFVSASPSLQYYSLSSQFTLPYTYKVAIKTIVPEAYIEWKDLKKHFELTSDTQLRSKLAEIFSFRNDISQRRETVEAALHTIITNYTPEIPSSVILRQKQVILDELILTPDYLVYKAHPEFAEMVTLLAIKQLQEKYIVDLIAKTSEAVATDQDIKLYIQLHQRPRTKELIYFDMPESKVAQQEHTLSHELVRQHCIREKILNSIIRTLKNK